MDHPTAFFAGRRESWLAGRTALTGGGLRLAAVLLLATGGLTGSAAASSTPFVSGQLLVGYRSAAGAGERAAIRRSENTRLKERLPAPGVELVELEQGQSVQAAVRSYERRAAVRYAEPNYIYSAYAMPNDPGFEQLWGMNNTAQDVGGTVGTNDADIDAPEAWGITTGSPNVTVAVVDSGAEFLDHPDLSPNIWLNPGEWPGTGGIDDDGNGYVDDLSGWDFVQNDYLPFDLNGHGTHVAGTIGARGNDGFGVVGVNWTVRMMILRVLDANGQGQLAHIASAFSYAGAKGAKVVNASLGGPPYSQTMQDAIANAPNTLFVVAAGNGGADQIGDNNDVTPDYPCAFTNSNLICVAATDQHDALTSFSNYGPVSVDLAAPGQNILSTLPLFAGLFGYEDGTSMASPHVAGAAALVYAHSPSATPAGVRAALLDSVETQPSLQGKVATGGGLNLYYALGGSRPTSPLPPAPTPTPVPAKPTVEVSFPKAGGKLSRRQLTQLRGTVSGTEGVNKVTVALERKSGKRCGELTERGLRKSRCLRHVYLPAAGTTSWRYRLGKRQRASLRPGAYSLRVQLLGASGAKLDADGTTEVRFSLKR